MHKLPPDLPVAEAIRQALSSCPGLNVNAPTDTTPHRPVSLRHYFLWLLMGVIGLFVGGMTLSVVFSLRANNAAEMRLLEVAAAQTRASVVRDWNYYQEVINNLARDPQLIDLMLVGSDEDRQQWAASRSTHAARRIGPGVGELQRRHLR